MSYLEKLKGKKVNSVHAGTSTAYSLRLKKEDKEKEFREPSISLIIEEYTLVVYSPGSLIGSEDQSFKTLEGRTIENILDADNIVEIAFSGGVLLRVNVDPDTFQGPEAMSLHGPGNLIVVWN